MKTKNILKIIILFLLLGANSVWSLSPTHNKYSKIVMVNIERNIETYKFYLKKYEKKEPNIELSSDLRKLYCESLENIDEQTKERLKNLNEKLNNFIKKEEEKSINKDNQDNLKNLKKFEENLNKRLFYINLLKLPSELLLEIAFFMKHDEVVNFFSSNKGLYKDWCFNKKYYFATYKEKLQKIYNELFYNELFPDLKLKTNKDNKLACEDLINEITKSKQDFDTKIKSKLEEAKIGNYLIEIIRHIIKLRKNELKAYIVYTVDRDLAYVKKHSNLFNFDDYNLYHEEKEKKDGNIDILLTLLSNKRYEDIWNKIYDILNDIKDYDMQYYINNKDQKNKILRILRIIDKNATNATNENKELLNKINNLLFKKLLFPVAKKEAKGNFEKSYIDDLINKNINNEDLIWRNEYSLSYLLFLINSEDIKLDKKIIEKIDENELLNLIVSGYNLDNKFLMFIAKEKGVDKGKILKKMQDMLNNNDDIKYFNNLRQLLEANSTTKLTSKDITVVIDLLKKIIELNTTVFNKLYFYEYKGKFITTLCNELNNVAENNKFDSKDIQNILSSIIKIENSSNYQMFNTYTEALSNLISKIEILKLEKENINEIFKLIKTTNEISIKNFFTSKGKNIRNNICFKIIKKYISKRVNNEGKEIDSLLDKLEKKKVISKSSIETLEKMINKMA